MEQRNIPMLNNGNETIVFKKSSDLKSIKSMQDLSSLKSWYAENPDKNHLGLVSFWNMKTTRPVGVFDEYLQNKSVLEVEGWDGEFTYDTPVETDNRCYTTKDMSYQTKAGIDGSPFKIVLNKEFAIGMVLTYDTLSGMQVSVVDEEPVRQVSEGWEHTVVLNDYDKNTWFPESNLVKGIDYFTSGHNIDGERGVHFANFEYSTQVDTMRHRFKLGAKTGVEAYMTGDAASKDFSGADLKSKGFLNELTSRFGDNDTVILAPNYRNSAGQVKPNLAKASLGSTMEYLVMERLQELTNKKLMWQKGGILRQTNGVTRLNEGLWHQMRRGTILKYPKRGGITIQLLIDAANYIYKFNPNLADHERYLEFKCGSEAYNNILRLFAVEINLQLARLAGTGLLGADGLLPKPLVTGPDNQNLSLGLVRFTTVFIEGLGNLKITRDVSLDTFGGNTDRNSGGTGNPGGKSYTTFSIIVMDTASQATSNNEKLPEGTKLIEGGSSRSNVFLVKPRGEMTFWGTTNGRYDYKKSGDVLSSMKTISQEFWAFNIVSILMMDPSRVLMIELTESAQKGFN